jgi:hypothetical protein
MPFEVLRFIGKKSISSQKMPLLAEMIPEQAETNSDQAGGN